MILLFFFQAEDGIRDRDVTGVQTCALPISMGVRAAETITTSDADIRRSPDNGAGGQSLEGLAAMVQGYLLRRTK